MMNQDDQKLGKVGTICDAPLYLFQFITLLFDYTSYINVVLIYYTRFIRLIFEGSMSREGSNPRPISCTPSGASLRHLLTIGSYNFIHMVELRMQMLMYFEEQIQNIT